MSVKCTERNRMKQKQDVSVIDLEMCPSSAIPDLSTKSFASLFASSFSEKTMTCLWKENVFFFCCLQRCRSSFKNREENQVFPDLDQKSFTTQVLSNNTGFDLHLDLIVMFRHTLCIKSIPGASPRGLRNLGQN